MIFRASYCDSGLADVVLQVKSTDYREVEAIFSVLHQYLDPSPLIHADSMDDVKKKTVHYANEAVKQTAIVLNDEKKQDLVSLLLEKEASCENLVGYGMASLYREYPIITGDEKEIVTQIQDYFQATFTLGALIEIEHHRENTDFEYMSSLKPKFDFFTSNKQRAFENFFRIMHASLHGPPEGALKN